ncbi:MAG: MlaD family protein [Phycisphaerales bacterium]
MGNVSDRQRNNVRAGIFVTACIVGAIVVTIFLSDSVAGLLRKERAYTLLFPVTGGVQSLQTGADVRLGGVSVGQVTGVELIPVDGDMAQAVWVAGRELGAAPDPSYAVEVGIEIDERFVLRGDADLGVGASIIGSDVWIDIQHLGGGAGALEVSTDERLVVGAGDTLLVTLLGKRSADRFEDILGNVDRITTAVAGDDGSDFDIDSAMADFGQTAANVRTFSENLSDVSGTAAGDYQRWRTEIDETIVWFRNTRDTSTTAVNNAAELLANANGWWGRNETRFTNIVTNTDGAMSEVRESTVPEVTSAAKRLGPMFTRAEDALAAISTVVEGGGSDLRETFVNGRLASQQITLLTEELRRSPWKLLYRPELQEYENELLYESARGLAFASESLEAAAADAARILDARGEVLEADPALAEQLRSVLGRPLEQYRDAEQRLLEVLQRLPRSGD